MIKKILFTILLTFPFIINSQIKGLTETGDEILLFENGTWKYLKDELNKKTEIVQNDEIFVKDSEATFLVKSARTDVGIWIDPNLWTFSKAEDSSPAELKFQIKDNEIYAMLVAEKIEVSNEALANIAYQNAYNSAENVKVITKEYRKVNDLDLIMMQMSGSIQGVKFVYFGYYYSSPAGAFQVITYVSSNQYEQSKEIMEKFLNGFVEL